MASTEHKPTIRTLYLEATCGHELIWTRDDPDPGEWDCPEHGRVGLWAQRVQPSPAGLPPMPESSPAITLTTVTGVAGSTPAIGSDSDVALEVAVAFRNALPELIAVVEAAERVKSIALDGDHALKDERIFDNLYEALAALDAKLSVT